jgi:hypothetical protein
VTPAILCVFPYCTKPATVTCTACEKRLCVTHYAGGSSTLCAKCFRDLEESRRQAASEAAS